MSDYFKTFAIYLWLAMVLQYNGIGPVKQTGAWLLIILTVLFIDCYSYVQGLNK